MADETHQRMSKDNSTRLRILDSALAVTYGMTFLSGFLQAPGTILSITFSFPFYS